METKILYQSNHDIYKHEKVTEAHNLLRQADA